MNKHTPAPWSLLEDRVPSSLEVIGSDGKSICELWRRANVEKEKADSRLIAAAPELLEALNDLLNACYKASIHDELSEIIDGKLMDAAQLAIAKARGE